VGERRFPLGQVVSTAGALNAFLRTDQDAWEFLLRHVSGDWGELDDDDRRENERSLTDGCRLMSVYTLLDGTRIWIITEADRSSTCVLLPEEF
jgi:hypothetical protein